MKPKGASPQGKLMPKILLFANTDWYLYNFRRSLAERLRDEGWDVVLVSPPGEYVCKLQALGFRWISLDFAAGGTNPLVELGVICRLITLYRHEQPNMVHHFTIKCVLYGSIAAQLVGKVPAVNSIPGLGYVFTDSGIKSRLLRVIARGFYRLVLNCKCSRTIFQNNEDLSYFVQTGLANVGSVRLIRGSGVSTQKFRPGLTSRPERDSPPVVLFAGRLLREKGIFELIEAVRNLSGTGCRLRLLVAGKIYPGNPSSLTLSELEDICNTPGVEYLGHIEDMPSLIAHSDIVALPTYYPEGTPRVLIEAAAMGLPIVATDIAGCRGLVKDGVNGYLIPIKNATALAAALQRLIADQALRQVMGAAGRAIVLAEFDEEIVLEKTLAVYRELL